MTALIIFDAVLSNETEKGCGAGDGPQNLKYCGICTSASGSLGLHISTKLGFFTHLQTTHIYIYIAHNFFLPPLLGVSKDKVLLYCVLAVYVNWTKYNSTSEWIGWECALNSCIPPVNTAREPTSCD